MPCREKVVEKTDIVLDDEYLLRHRPALRRLFASPPAKTEIHLFP